MSCIFRGIIFSVHKTIVSSSELPVVKRACYKHSAPLYFPTDKLRLFLAKKPAPILRLSGVKHHVLSALWHAESSRNQVLPQLWTGLATGGASNHEEPSFTDRTKSR